MSDDASSSAVQATSTDPSHHDEPASAPLTSAEVAARRKQNRQTFNRKRGEQLDDLLRAIDLLVYAQLSTIYYLDCSFLRLLLRALPHFVFLTPKPPFFPDHPADRPYIGTILGTTLLCLLLHALYAPPTAGEATRGYLHGGLVMDFIGQQGGASRAHLLLLDLVVLGLQLTQLCVKTTKERLSSPNDSAVTVTTSSGQDYPAPPPPSQQDLDSEERGVRRSEEANHTSDIELQPLNPPDRASSPAPSNSRSPASHPLSTPAYQISDAFNSGQLVLADLNLSRTLAHHLRLSRSAAHEPQNFNRALRANLVGQLLRWRGGGTATAVRDPADQAG